MKKADVKVGGTYTAKVSDKVTSVRIDEEHPQGGWNATNMSTGKKVRIKSAQRLRGPASKNAGKPLSDPAAEKARREAIKEIDANFADDDGKAMTGSEVIVHRPEKGGAWTYRVDGVASGKRYMSQAQAIKGAKKAKPGAEVRVEDDTTATTPAPAKGGKKAASGTPKAKDAPRAKRGDDKAGPKRRGILDVAAEILAKSKEPMTAKAMVDHAIEKGMWQTSGATPAATLYAAIIREIAAKGKDARFEKVDRGLFIAKKGS